jgi:hypothetical protein
MDYTLLTAAHIHEKTPPKMDAKHEQEYYENAAGASMRLEGLLQVALFPTTLPTYFLDIAGLAASHIRAVAAHFNNGGKERRSMT